MSATLKPDADGIRKFLTELLNRDAIKRTERRVWPRYGFHYTDIQNAARVLRSGHLFCRNIAEQTGNLIVSSGSIDVLANTGEYVKDHVRLYFRPKTPTQYHVEGVRTEQYLRQSKFPNAHCPIPVFLLFDLPALLSRVNVKFSDRGLGGHGYNLFSSAADLRRLPWEKIYHNTWIDIADPERSDIIACRNAEIIIPQSLDLTHLKYIYCRSAPERETLLSLLPRTIADKFESRIVSSSRVDCFYRQFTFVEDARLLSDTVHVSFSPDTKTAGPYTLRYVFNSSNGEMMRSRVVDNFYVTNSNRNTQWRIQTPASNYSIEIWLDTALVYRGSHKDNFDIPF